jgi:alpha-L-fucosidase
MELPGKRLINHVVIMEDYREGQRIREYSTDGFVNGEWVELCKGQSIGRKKIDYFEQVEASKLRLNVKKSVGEPLIQNFSAYYVNDFEAPPKGGVSPWSAWQELSQWELPKNEEKTLEIDLTGRIKLPGQYTIMVEPADKDAKVTITAAKMLYDGHPTLEKFVSIEGGKIHINRTAQVTDESEIKIILVVKSKSSCSGVVKFKPALIY